MKNHNNEILRELINKFIEKEVENSFLIHIVKNYPDINWESQKPGMMEVVLEAIEKSKQPRVERKKHLLDFTHYLLETNRFTFENNEQIINFIIKYDYTEMIELLFTRESIKKEILKNISDNKMVAFFKPRMLDLFSKNEDLKKNTYLSVFNLRNEESVVKALQVEWGNIYERNSEGKNLIDTTIDKLYVIKQDNYEEDELKSNNVGKLKHMFEILRLAETKIFNDNIETFLKSFTIKSIKPSLFKNIHSQFLSKIDMDTLFNYKENQNANILELILLFFNDKENNIKKDSSVHNKFLSTVTLMNQVFSRIADKEKIENIIETASSFTNRNNMLGEIILNIVLPSNLKESEKQSILQKEFVNAIINNDYNKAIVIHQKGLSEEISKKVLSDDIMLKSIFQSSSLSDYFSDKLEDSVKERCYIKMIQLHKQNKSITDMVIKNLSQYSSEEYYGMKQILEKEYPETYKYFFHEKDGRFIKNKKASVMNERFDISQQMKEIQVSIPAISKNRL